MSNNNSFDNEIGSHMKRAIPEGLTHGERERVWSEIRPQLVARPVGLFHMPKWTKNLATLLIVGVTLMGTGIATASAHEGIMPGDFLFPVEIATEKAQIFLARDIATKESLRIKFAEKRLAEVRTLVNAAQSAVNTTTATSSINTIITGTTTDVSASSTSSTVIPPPATTTLYLTKGTLRKIERTERGITAALRELEETRNALLADGSDDGANVVDDIIDELNGVGDGRVTIEKIASGKGKSEHLSLRANINNGSTTSPDFSGKIEIEHNARNTNLKISGENISTRIRVKMPQQDTEDSHGDENADVQNDEKQRDDRDNRQPSRTRDEGERRSGDQDERGSRKTTLCHNDNNTAVTIQVSASAARAHLLHGDRLGKCKSSTSGDVVAPIISDLIANPGTTTVRIGFKTNEQAQARLFIGLTPSISTSVPNAEMTGFSLNHSFNLAQLAPQTTYYYIVSASDRLANRTTSTTGTFTTGASSFIPPPAPVSPSPVLTPPSIPDDTSAPTVSDLSIEKTTTTATLTWTTNEAAKAHVWLVTSSPINVDGVPTKEEGAFSSTHSMSFADLTPDTTYHVVLSVADAAGNRATTSEHNFKTNALPPIDTTAPEIKDIHVSATTTQATISWETSEIATSALYYSDAALLDILLGTKISLTNPSEDHSVTLTDLAASTTYRYLIAVKDGNGNQRSSATLSFTTP